MNYESGKIGLIENLLYVILRAFCAIGKYISDKYRRSYHKRIQKSLKSRGYPCWMKGEIKIISAESMEIGDHVGFNENFFCNAAGGVTIGNYVHFAPNVSILSINHNYRSDKKIPYDDEYVRKPVVIEDFVWIGYGVMITPGVKIGEGAVIGMGSVVTSDIPAWAIAGGNPARVIGFRDKDLFSKLKKEGKFHF